MSYTIETYKRPRDEFWTATIRKNNRYVDTVCGEWEWSTRRKAARRVEQYKRAEGQQSTTYKEVNGRWIEV